MVACSRVAGMRHFLAGLDSEQRIHIDSDRASFHAVRALAALRLASDALPGRPDVAAATARVLDRLGRAEEAMRLLEPLVAIPQPWTPVVQAYARLAGTPDHVLRAIDLLRRATARTIDDAKREPLLYELAGLLDRIDDVDGAFAAAAAANRLTGLRLGAIATRSLPQLVADLRTRSPLPLARSTEPPSRLPVFLVGFGRSGKTVLEALLAAHPAVAALGERRLAVPRLLHALGTRITALGLPTGDAGWTADVAAAAGRTFLAGLAKAAPGAQRAIDTAPENGLVLPAIGAALPGAIVLHLVRDPRDTCLDMYFHFQKSRLMRSWDPGQGAAALLSYRRLAEIWRQRYGIRLPQLRYEQMVTNPRAVRDEVFRLLGLPPLPQPPRLQRPAVDPAARIDRSTVVETEHWGRWRRYRRHLGPVLDVFGEAEEPILGTTPAL